MVLVYLVLAVALSWQMTLIIGVAGALILVVLRSRVRRGSDYGHQITAMAFEMWPEASEHIDAAKTVKAYNVESSTIRRFDEMTARFMRLQYKNAMNQGWLRFSYETISMLAVFSGIYLAVTYFGMSIPSLMVFLLVFYRISPRISGVQGLQTQVLVLVPALKAVDQLTAEALAARDVSGTGAVAPLRTGIALDQVDFEYHPGASVLHDVSIEIPKGRSVAIVGPSGSGKTTIVDLLLGVLSPTSGAVRVDGTPLTDLSLHGWRSRIGYVAQDSSFFHDTVRQNIRFGCSEATDEQIAEAASLAFADGFIAELPEGYDTVIGDRGVRLSGGQRQRLALARAIVRRPDILVLDEATSALDAESEEKIQRAVEMLSKQMTVVIVTHRLATVRDVDLIHFLENGRLIESGSWEQLVAKGGRFGEMQAMQSLS
jgi:ABC-type multidrug transport system fused ATPase/permease subunit